MESTLERGPQTGPPDARQWPAELRRGLRGLALELLGHARRAIAAADRLNDVRQPAAAPLMESAAASKRRQWTLTRRPLAERIYRTNPPAFELTTLQRCILRALDEYAEPLIRAELCRLTGVAYAPINKAIPGLLRPKLIDSVDSGGFIAYRLLPPAVVTDPDSSPY